MHRYSAACATITSLRTLNPDDRLHRRISPESLDVRHREVQRDPGASTSTCRSSGIGAVELGSYRRPLLSLKLSEFTRRRCRRPGPLGRGAPRASSSCSCTRSTAPTSSSGWWRAAGARLLRQHASSSRSCVPLRPDIQELFCPGTILNPQRFQRTELSVFTFGMAHKIRVPLYRRLQRSARRDRAELFGLRVDGAAREHQLRRLVRRPVRGAAVDLQRAGLLHGLPVGHGGVQPPDRLHVPGRVLREGAAGEQHHGERGDGVRLRGDHQPRRAFAGRARRT